MTFDHRPPPQAGQARALYLEGLRLVDIARRTGLSPTMARYWADRVVGADGKVTHDPLPRRRAATPRIRRQRLIDRLWEAADTEIAALEVRLAGLAPESPGREDAARALGLLARLLRDLAALDALEDKARAQAGRTGEAGGEADADFIDIDAFRAGLAQQLEALAASRAA